MPAAATGRAGPGARSSRHHGDDHPLVRGQPGRGEARKVLGAYLEIALRLAGERRRVAEIGGELREESALLSSSCIAAALALRIWDPAPVARFRALVFDTYQQISPRNFDPNSRAHRRHRRGVAEARRAVAVAAHRACRARRKSSATTVRRRSVSTWCSPSLTGMSPANALRFWPKSDALAGLRDEVEKLPSNDQVFAEAIGQGARRARLHRRHRKAARSRRQRPGFAHGGDDPQLFAPSYPGAAASLPELQDKARRGLAQLAARTRPDHPPHADAGSGRRQALSLLRGRRAADRARCLDLHGQILRREQREGVRREDRHRQRSASATSRFRPKPTARCGSGSPSRPRTRYLPAWKVLTARSAGGDRRPHRLDRHERRGPARPPRDAARSLRSRRRAARPGRRADPAGLLPAAARFRHGRPNCSTSSCSAFSSLS